MVTGLLTSIETALQGLTPDRLCLAEEEHWSGVERLRGWSKDPGRVLLGLHTGRVSLLAAAGIVAYRLAASAGWCAFGLCVGVPLLVALLEVLIAQLVPRRLAKHWSYTWAVRTMWIAELLGLASLPLLIAIRKPSQAIARRLHGEEDSDIGLFWTPMELQKLSVEAREQVIGERNERILRSIIEFSDTIIREIMVPRTGMVAIPVNSDLTEAVRIASESGHSRIPIYEETIDNVVGLLHVKALYARLLSKVPENRFDLNGLLRPIFFVPEVMPISELLREFQRRKTHMAIAVDEYGGTAGVVTLEDIIEEIVGEIQDEHDVEEKQFRQTADGKIIADGRVHVWDLGQALHVRFPETANYETLAGFVIEQLGYIPEVGAVITWETLRFVVKEADDKRVRLVEIERVRG